MNLIIEVIDGVAYVVDKTNEPFKSCGICVAGRSYETAKCSMAKMCKLHSYNYYRLLTSKERVELQKAIGRGLG